MTPPRTAREKWAIALAIAQLLVMFVAVIAAWVNVESIIGTGPALSIIGLALAIVSMPCRSWIVLSFALSGPLVCMLGALLIARLHWGPSEASRPIAVLLSVYFVAALPLSAMARRRINTWLPTQAAHAPAVWHYSLKSLLALTTAVCLIIAVVRPIVAAAGPGDYFIFDLFNVATAALTCGSVYLFIGRRIGG
jgi:hypothetical protein